MTTTAERKAAALLRTSLSTKQLRQWNSRRSKRFFDVIGQKTGRRYRLTKAQNKIAYEINDEDCVVASYCIEWDDTSLSRMNGDRMFWWSNMPPEDDKLVAVKLLIELDERRFLKTARRRAYNPTWDELGNEW